MFEWCWDSDKLFVKAEKIKNDAIIDKTINIILWNVIFDYEEWNDDMKNVVRTILHQV